MDIQEILSRLQRNEGHFPGSAVRGALAHRDEIIPPLLAVLESAAQDPQSFARDPDRMVHIYAMYLLAQFRETQAYPLLVQMFSAPGELPFDLAGDTVTEGLDSILASVSDGEMSGMASLVENARANEYVRSAALSGLVTLVACGKRSRDELIAYFKGLFCTLDRTYSLIWDSLASRCADLSAAEVKEDLRQVHEQGLIDPGYIGWEDIEGALGAGKEAAMKTLGERYRLIDDVEKEMCWWACFEENKRRWHYPSRHHASRFVSYLTLPAPPRFFDAEIIQHAPRRDLYKPATRIVRDTFLRPLHSRRQQPLLDCILCGGEVMETANHRS